MCLSGYLWHVLKHLHARRLLSSSTTAAIVWHLLLLLCCTGLWLRSRDWEGGVACIVVHSWGLRLKDIRSIVPTDCPFFFLFLLTTLCLSLLSLPVFVVPHVFYTSLDWAIKGNSCICLLAVNGTFSQDRMKTGLELQQWAYLCGVWVSS